MHHIHQAMVIHHTPVTIAEPTTNKTAIQVPPITITQATKATETAKTMAAVQ